MPGAGNAGDMAAIRGGRRRRRASVGGWASSASESTPARSAAMRPASARSTSATRPGRVSATGFAARAAEREALPLPSAASAPSSAEATMPTAGEAALADGLAVTPAAVALSSTLSAVPAACALNPALPQTSMRVGGADMVPRWAAGRRKQLGAGSGSWVHGTPVRLRVRGRGSEAAR